MSFTFTPQNNQAILTALYPIFCLLNSLILITLSLIFHSNLSNLFIHEISCMSSLILIILILQYYHSKVR